MILKSNHFNLFLMFSSVVATIVFCLGFFPYSVNQISAGSSTDGVSLYNRSILMIIDALRLDFIDSSNFDYLHLLLRNNEACLLKVSVNLPTVTKPRIKALTSGTIPSFLDVVMNFGHDGMVTDTFLSRLDVRQDKIVFAGDDTWKMFRMFQRAYFNRDSLFVNDFYEGDRNVTDSLRHELKRDDWKLLILHYLGLDHIGHVEGPFSKLVPSKLQEMDSVIKLIHEKISKWNKYHEQKSVLIVTTDHGMRDSGGHSGNSYAEIHVPLLIIGDSDCRTNNETFYKQIDFATTFSLVNGLPVPTDSIGSIIPEMLAGLKPTERLAKLEIANKRLLTMIGREYKEGSNYQYERAKKFHELFQRDHNDQNAYQEAETNYLESSRKLSDELAQRVMDVDLFLVLVGLGINLIISFIIMIPTELPAKDLRFGVLSFIPFMIGAILLKTVANNEVFQSFVSNYKESLACLMVLSILVRIVFGILCKTLNRFKIPYELFKSDFLYLLLCGQLLFIVSVSSSSFIEEEHQIWYYFCNTIFIICVFFEFRGSRERSIEGTIVKCFPLLFLHIIIRRFNQTGDKWINLADLSDWFHVNKHWLHALVTFTLLASSVWLIVVHSSKKLIPSISIATILLFLHHTRELNYSSDIPITTLFWVNIAGLVAIEAVTNYKNGSMKFNFFVVFYLISLLLHQPHNLVMVFSCALTCWFINGACDRLVRDKTERIIAKIILHWWVGKLFYFYQGNSNSLTTIDVTAGFVGQMHVHLPIVLIFSIINTFNGQLLSLMLLIIHLRRDTKNQTVLYSSEDDSETIVKLLLKWLAILTIIPTSYYLIVITLLRHHLFIWSVFSPKLLYTTAENLVVFIIMTIIKFIIKF